MAKHFKKIDELQVDAETSVGKSAAMMSVLVIFSRITGFVRTWGQAFALGTTLLSSCYTVANNLPNQLYELVIGGMIITAFLPVYLDVKQRFGPQGGQRLHLESSIASAHRSRRRLRFVPHLRRAPYLGSVRRHRSVDDD